MRFLARVTIPKGHEASEAGALPRTIQSAMQELNPEAAYFIEDEGKRECFFVFHLDLPALLMPLFRSLDASLVVMPVMNAAEFQQRLGAEKEEQPPATQPDILDEISPVPSGAPGYWVESEPRRPDLAEEETKKWYT